MRITSKGQVTIPIDIRERFGFLPDTEVDFVVEGEIVQIVRRAGAASSRGRRIVERLWGTATGGMSTDEIMALTRGEDDDGPR